MNTPTRSVQRARGSMRAARRRSLAAWMFLMPNFIGFLAFILVPVAFALVLSFTYWDLLSWPPRFIGLRNFAELLRDKLFWESVFNTVFLMMAIPISMAGSLGLAMLLNRGTRGRHLFRTMFFLPTFTAGVALCLLWKWLLNTEYGLINVGIVYLGDLLGQDWRGLDWLGSKHLAKPALMLMSLWVGVGGYNMILYLAGLQGISPELYEAADIDGATGWQKFRHITWPLLAPTTFFIFIMSVIGGFQGGFEQAFIMTQGGPDFATTTISYYIYSNAFEFYRMGYAAAISWFLFLLVLVVTLVNWRYGGRKVHYV